MSEFATIGVDVDEVGIATVELRRPPNNFFSMVMIGEIAGALETLAADGTARVVLLCSEGKHFCAGADFANREPVDPDGPHLYDMAARVFRQPLPIVAAIQGAAVGGGLGLAMAADFRVATPAARLTANFARLGFHQGFALSVTLPRVIGHQAAQDVLYTGKRLTGDEAAAMGLVDRLVEPDQLRAEATALAAEIAGSAPLAVRSIRATLREGLADAAVAAMARERAEQERLQRTNDWREGVAAMAERRPPDFTGT